MSLSKNQKWNLSSRLKKRDYIHSHDDTLQVHKLRIGYRDFLYATFALRS